jgi:hypothetical protein
LHFSNTVSSLTGWDHVSRHMKNKIITNPVYIIKPLPTEQCTFLKEEHLGRRKTRYGLWWTICVCYVAALARTTTWNLVVLQTPLHLPLWKSLIAWRSKIWVNLIVFDCLLSAFRYDSDWLLACLAINSWNSLHSYIINILLFITYPVILSVSV